jgi:CDP-diacylglycerol--serine O-phosphatidyltransferase
MTPRAFDRARKLGAPGAFKRGVALLPSLFTVGNMFCGYYAIILGSKHRFEWAVTFIVLAGILDSLDGRIARMTGSESEFGKELDSLSDFLSFGLAPALVLYHWGFSDLGRLGWLLPFLLPVAGAMRLARFNIQAGKIDKMYFVGLPIPAGAAAAVLPLYYLPSGIPEAFRAAALGYVVTLSLLMVSRVKYRSFKEFDLRQRRSPMLVFVMAVILVLVAWNPTAFMLASAVVYAASGPASWLAGRVFPPKAPPSKAAEPGVPS